MLRGFSDFSCPVVFVDVLLVLRLCFPVSGWRLSCCSLWVSSFSRVSHRCHKMYVSHWHSVKLLTDAVRSRSPSSWIGVRDVWKRVDVVSRRRRLASILSRSLGKGIYPGKSCPYCHALGLVHSTCIVQSKQFVIFVGIIAGPIWLFIMVPRKFRYDLDDRWCWRCLNSSSTSASYQEKCRRRISIKRLQLRHSCRLVKRNLDRYARI